MEVGKEDFSAKDIYDFLNSNPKLREINAGIMRNEGLKISLENDYEV